MKSENMLYFSAEDGNAYALTLGQEEEVRVSVFMDNYGESAYEGQLFVQHHSSLHYIAANISVS